MENGRTENNPVTEKSIQISSNIPVSGTVMEQLIPVTPKSLVSGVGTYRSELDTATSEHIPVEMAGNPVVLPRTELP
jgi:hypothetical protein